MKRETPQATAEVPALQGREEVNRETEGATGRGRRRYQRELSQRLSGQAEAGLTLAAQVTMARVRRPACGG